MNLLKKTYQILPEEFRFRIIFIFFSSILVVLLEVFSIALILPILTILIDPDKLSFLNNYFDFEILISNLDKNEIIIYGISFFLFIIICKIIALVLLNIYKTNFYFDVRVRMTEILFKKYLHESYLFHIYNNSSILITNVYGEIGLFVKKILNVLSDIFLDLILFFLLLAILLNIRLFETLFALSAFIIFLLTYFYLIKKRLDFWGKERQKKDRSKLKHIQQSLFGIKELKIYLKETFFEKILLNVVRKRENIAKKVAYISPLPRYFLELGTVIFILIFTIFFTKTDNFSQLLPEFALYFASFLRMLPIFIKIFNSLQTIKLGIPTIKVLHSEFTRKNDEEFNQIDINTNEMNFKKDIEFQNIGFKYPTKDDSILENIDLKFEQGKIIGIIGLTGSGKTTFLNLLTGLIKPTKGKIFCDSVDINEKSINWRKKISYVTQKTFLIDDSIRKNIIFGETEQLNSKKLEESLKLSNLEKFISNLPEGINTIVGEGGTQLSGGQIQRISIARALYNSPEIIIFDEATNSLDEKTENSIIKEIFNLKGKCTIFLVTHNKDLTANCDEKYLVENKKITKI